MRLYWSVTGIAVLSALVCFPPQRRVGDWRDTQGQSMPAEQAKCFDRLEFGFLPSFQWLSNIGRQRPTGYLTTTTSEGHGPYLNSTFHWTLDWFWAAMLSALVLIVLAASMCRHAMRYRLRTLLIVAAVAPPGLALTYWMAGETAREFVAFRRVMELNQIATLRESIDDEELPETFNR